MYEKGVNQFAVYDNRDGIPEGFKFERVLL